MLKIGLILKDVAHPPQNYSVYVKPKINQVFKATQHMYRCITQLHFIVQVQISIIRGIARGQGHRVFPFGNSRESRYPEFLSGIPENFIESGILNFFDQTEAKSAVKSP